MTKLGYDFKLVPKQKETRLSEILEIEGIARNLANRDIYIGNKILQKAIMFDNERETLGALGTKLHPETGEPLPAPEFEVKYPGIADQLLVNPFAVAKKEKGKKKKKK